VDEIPVAATALDAAAEEPAVVDDAPPKPPRRRSRRVGGGPRETEPDLVAVTPPEREGVEPLSPELTPARPRAALKAAERREARRPRHTKPRRERDGTVKLIVGAGRKHGLEPADVIAAIVDASHLEGEDIHNVRLLDRFTFVEVPAQRAEEVVEKVNGSDVRGVKLRLEVAGRP
jgi:hypothetical protein